MAQYSEDPLRRTDANEIRFQETVPDDKKYASTEEGIKSLPKGGQDVGIHVDRPSSVTSETGYGGISGRGNDISGAVAEAREHQPKLDHKGGESFSEKTKNVAEGVKDLVTGKKQEEASKPVVDQGNYAERAHAHGRKEGAGGKVRDFVTGQKPGHGTATTEGSEEWPQSATYTDPHGRPVEGPRDDNTKKEGVMSKVMDKFNLGTANK